MKKLFKSISLISLLLSSHIVFGASSPKAVVESIKGNVFVTRAGETSNLVSGDYLYDFDQVITEVGAQITFKDYFDHSYHLAGSGYVAILNKMIELKGGYLWVQSMTNSSELFQVQTINAQASYSKGEFIVSYDQESGKTQLLSIKGTHLFSNNENSYMKEEVSDGKFSFISEQYENGAPRMPTPIGQSAYGAVVSLYTDIKPLETNRNAVSSMAKVNISAEEAYTTKASTTGTKRTIASVSDESGKGEMIFVKQEVQEDNSNALKNFYKSKVTEMSKQFEKKPKKFAPDYNQKSSVSIKVYGQASKGAKSSSQRMPASVISGVAKKMRTPASMTELNPQVTIKNDAFEQSLIDQYKIQMRHSKEINNLINDLKSYDQDYKQSY